MKNNDTICFAGGCFWGTEHFMRLLPGVTDTQVGYANSQVPDPSYELVCTGTTGAAEAVMVSFDPENVDLRRLIRIYFMTIDPTSLNRQGNDHGTQYRTGIYYTSDRQQLVAEEVAAEVAGQYSRKLAVEILPLENFYPAEEYHQDYLGKNPRGYCHLDRRLFEMARRTDLSPSPDDELRRRLSPMQFMVTRRNATEPPFRNEYWNEFRKGIYVDIISGKPLFASSDKFESGCGWPAFSRPLPGVDLTEQKDTSNGMIRTEVRNPEGSSHLGHVFNDGPEESGGMRYCINSASLRFIPLEEMAKEGYSELIPYVEAQAAR